MILSFTRNIFLYTTAALYLYSSSTSVNALSIPSEIILENLNHKRELFLSAPKFAVYGASDDEDAVGTRVFKDLLEHGKDVVPINPFSSTSQRIHCLQSFSELSDPTGTAISITSHPSIALEIIHEAQNYGVHLIWLHPSGPSTSESESESNDNNWGRVLQYLDAHPEMSDKVFYSPIEVSLTRS